MKKMMITTVASLMAWVAFADKSDATKDADTNAVPIVLNIGSLRPGGNTPVFKASDFKDLEKIDFTDITNIKLGTTLADMGEFDMSKADSDFCSLKIPCTWSDGGKSEALRVTFLLVDRKTREIKGAVTTNVYPSVEAGVYAITNSMVFTVAQKKNPTFVSQKVGKDGVGRYNYEWDDAEGRRIEMANSCIVNKTRQMFILTLLHVKGDGITVMQDK